MMEFKMELFMEVRAAGEVCYTRGYESALQGQLSHRLFCTVPRRLVLVLVFLLHSSTRRPNYAGSGMKD